MTPVLRPVAAQLAAPQEVHHTISYSYPEPVKVPYMSTIRQRNLGRNAAQEEEDTEAAEKFTTRVINLQGHLQALLDIDEIAACPTREAAEHLAYVRLACLRLTTEMEFGQVLQAYCSCKSEKVAEQLSMVLVAFMNRTLKISALAAKPTKTQGGSEDDSKDDNEVNDTRWREIVRTFFYRLQRDVSNNGLSFTERNRKTDLLLQLLRLQSESQTCARKLRDFFCCCLCPSDTAVSCAARTTFCCVNNKKVMLGLLSIFLVIVNLAASIISSYVDLQFAALVGSISGIMSVLITLLFASFGVQDDGLGSLRATTTSRV